MHVCFFCFSFSVLSQKIDCEERLQTDLICVGWDRLGRKTLTYSVELNVVKLYEKSTFLFLFFVLFYYLITFLCCTAVLMTK